MRLGHLDPDRTATYDNQVLRAIREVENRLVGQNRHRVDSRDGRNRRVRAGRYYEAPRAHT